MEMFLMILCMSLFSLALTAIAFGAATRRDYEAEALAEQAAEPVAKSAEARFFAADVAVPRIPQPQVPIEALLLQIDNHVRLEQAAAESFVQFPTAALLHSRTMSPLVH